MARIHDERQPLRPAYGFVHVRDVAVVAFSALTYLVAEGAAATITVTKTGAGAASVRYTTADATAAAGSDYTAASGLLTWAEGDEAPKTFTVQTAADAAAEGSEYLVLTLLEPVGAMLGEPSVASLVILEADAGGGGGDGGGIFARQILFVDNMVAADGTDLRLQPPDVGARYLNVYLPNEPTFDSVIRIIDNAARATGTSGNLIQTPIPLDAIVPPTDWYAELTFRLQPTGGLFFSLDFPLIQLQNPANESPYSVSFSSGWVFRIDTISAALRFMFMRQPAAAVTLDPVDFDFNAKHVYRVEVEGGAIRHYLDRVLVAQSASGYAGPSIYRQFLALDWDTDDSANPRMRVERIELGVLPGKVYLTRDAAVQAQDLTINRSDYSDFYETNYLDASSVVNDVQVGGVFGEDYGLVARSYDWRIAGPHFIYYADGRTAYQLTLPVFDFVNLPATPERKILVVSNNYNTALTPIPKPVLTVNGGAPIAYDYTAVTGADIVNLLLSWDGSQLVVEAAYSVFRDPPL